MRRRLKRALLKADQTKMNFDENGMLKESALKNPMKKLKSGGRSVYVIGLPAGHNNESWFSGGTSCDEEFS